MILTICVVIRLVLDCFGDYIVVRVNKRNKKHIFRAFRVEITINHRTGVTEWTNWVGHPLLDHETRVGPFKVMKTDDGSLTTLNTWSTDRYIQLTCKPGETSRDNIKAAAKKIHKWNKGLMVKGSKQQKLISELLTNDKRHEFRIKEPTKYEGLSLIGHERTNSVDEYFE